MPDTISDLAPTAGTEAAEEHRHLVSVWNPSYAADPMDDHLAVLRDLARRYRRREIAEHEVYVWWAKLRSSERPHPLLHQQAVAGVADQLQRAPCEETHLYLTDYRSLYVGQLVAIAFNDVRPAAACKLHIPNYVCQRTPPPAGTSGRARRSPPPYRHHADCWLKLTDIRRIVADDTPGVIQELSQLHNVRENGRRVSPYSSMHDFPLIVTRPQSQRFFEPDERDHDSGRWWWAELDAERGQGVSLVERDLRDNVLGADVWQRLEPTARAFVAGAEMIFRQHRNDPAFDFSQVIVSMGKAIEVQMRWLVRAAVAACPEGRTVQIHGEAVDLLDATRKMPTLGQLTCSMDYPPFRRALERLGDGAYLVGDFRRMLDRFLPVRNRAAHDSPVLLGEAAKWRDDFLGVGRAGILERFALVHPKRRRDGGAPG